MFTNLKYKAAGALAAFIGLAAGCIGVAFADPYEKYRGTELVVSWPALPHFVIAEKLIPEFTEETGISVEVDALQYLKLHDKQLLEMGKPNGEYDVVSWWYSGRRSTCRRAC